MGNGIFRRLLLTYIIILVIIVGLLSLALAQFFTGYFFQQKQDELLNVGRHVKTQLIRFRRQDVTKQQLVDYINTVGLAANARIIVIDSGQPESGLFNGISDKDFRAILPRVINGETVVRRQQFAAELNTYVMVVGLPAMSAEGRKGAVLLFAPVYEVNSALQRVYKTIGVVALVSLAVGLLLVWVTSRRISRPIIELSGMAEEIALGRSVADAPEGDRGEIGQLAASFNCMKNQLARTEKARSEFIAGVSHELRTPLTSLRGFIQGILDGVIPVSEQNRYLRLAFAEISRITGLTSELLELTRLEARAINLDKRRVSVGQMVDESLLSVYESIGEKEVLPEIVIEPEDLVCLVDPDRFKQILINLLSNAFKFTPTKGRIRVEAFCRDGLLLVRILDNGTGIPADELPLIFEKFHRVEKSRGTADRGAGLGLSIVKNLVELHGGVITVDSIEGQGTCFEVSVPCVEKG